MQGQAKRSGQAVENGVRHGGRAGLHETRPEAKGRQTGVPTVTSATRVGQKRRLEGQAGLKHERERGLQG